MMDASTANHHIYGMHPLLVLALLGLITWFWHHNLRIREQAIRVARQACQRQGYQLLDETVNLQNLRPRRDARGHVALLRTYRFDYSAQAIDRRQGFVIMLGHHVQALGLAADDNTPRQPARPASAGLDRLE